ncbi:MAG: putative sortase-like protein, partial [Frankiales bacterium]|nr:putative sortase-like protein [Frankiales bacterium]
IPSSSPPADVATGPATPLGASPPRRLRVPSIGVDTELVGLGLQPDGSLEVPPAAFPVGWYTGGPAPGELGPAVLAGHVDYAGSAGVFADLGDLRPGAQVLVDRQDGSTAVFRVTRVHQVGKAAFPTAAVYGDLDHAGLRLITCGGDFSRRAGSYEDNVIAYAELVESA